MKLTPLRAFAPALVLLAVALAGCSGGGSTDSDAAGSASSLSRDDGAAAEAPAPAASDRDALEGAAYSIRSTGAQQGAQEPVALEQRALIRKGNVALRAHDVGKAQFEVQKAVDRYGGQVTEERTTTDDEGEPAYTRMVLRIPSEDFDEAMEELKGVAELESANTSEDDVTTKLIDTRTRLAVQRRSIARITTLFERAQSIRDIMAIEAQLSRRQADLDSLERQLAFLTNQTSLSTITVSVDRIPEKQAAPKEEDDTGFVSGLSAGWSSLTTFAVGLATVAGALLPWLVVVVVLGPPVLLLVRATRRRRTQPEPEATPAEG